MTGHAPGGRRLDTNNACLVGTVWLSATTVDSEHLGTPHRRCNCPKKLDGTRNKPMGKATNSAVARRRRRREEDHGIYLSMAEPSGGAAIWGKLPTAVPALRAL